MEIITVRAYQLKLSDIFRKSNVTYFVVAIDENGIYYNTYVPARMHNQEKISRYHFGPVSREIVELVERSNFN